MYMSACATCAHKLYSAVGYKMLAGNQMCVCVFVRVCTSLDVSGIICFRLILCHVDRVRKPD